MIHFLSFVSNYLRSSFSFISGNNEIPQQNGILILTCSNFQQALRNYEPLVVKFYLPWCANCKYFEPEFLKVAKLLKVQDSNINLAQVDADVERTLARLYHVQGLPAIRLFKNGEFLIYDGPKKAENIITWINRNC